MAQIAISMFPEEGHLIPSFRLAHQLQDAGHTITYVGLPDYEQFIRDQGFLFVPFMAQEFPAGWRKKQIEILATSKGRKHLKELSQTPFYKALCKLSAQESGEISTLINNLKPDLWIIDGFLAPLTLRVKHAGISAVTLSININLSQSDNYPPVVVDMIPDDSPASRSRIGSAWGISGMIRGITSMMVGFNFLKELQKLAVQYGGSKDDVINAALFPKLRASDDVPELIVCSREFDFPRPDGFDPATYFIGPSLDISTKDNSFDWDQLKANKKLAFCTLGSQSHLYEHGRKFFQAAIESIASKPDWQLVVATGPHVDPASFGTPPENVIITRWAPHSAMLKRADLMINHGGLGTIKECIYFDVPMLCFPITRDQPGYAARVAYHGLGLMGNIKKVTSATISEMIDTIEQDASFRNRIQEMGKIFRQAELNAHGVDVIEQQLEPELQLA